MEKQTTIAGLEGTLTYNYNKNEKYPATARFKTEDHGSFYGYGNEKRQALRELERNVQKMADILANKEGS